MKNSKFQLKKTRIEAYTLIKDLKQIFSVWGILGDKLGSQAVYDRLMDVWQVILGVAGLVAGFSYVVLSAGIEFTHEGTISKNARKTIYGIFSVTALIASLCAALVAVILYNVLKIAGPDYAIWFVKTYGPVILLPTQLLIYCFINCNACCSLHEFECR